MEMSSVQRSGWCAHNLTLEEASWGHRSSKHSKLNHPKISWKGSRARHKQPRRFLHSTADSILTPMVCELSWAGLLLTDKMNLHGEMNAEDSHGYNDHEVVEK